MRFENTWQEIRDHFFIQSHSRSFRFPTHLLQGSGQGTRMAEAQWPIFVLFLRFVFGLLSGWKIQTWPIIRFLMESVTFWSVMPCVYTRCPGLCTVMVDEQIQSDRISFESTKPNHSNTALFVPWWWSSTFFIQALILSLWSTCMCDTTGKQPITSLG